MILPDINLLAYAYNSDAPIHAKAKAWLERIMNGQATIGFAWAVVCGFIRLMTHPSVMITPLAPKDAIVIVETWMRTPQVEIIEPGPRHLEILSRLLMEIGVAGNLTTDAHLAAIAIEHQCELHSNDGDFGRFSGLRWTNPL